MSSQNELQVELERRPEPDHRPPHMRLAIPDGLQYVREAGNRLTGGGLRSLANRRLKCLRAAGDRITGGGLRALTGRILSTSLRWAMRHPFLKAVGRNALRPFPKLSAHLYHLATEPGPVIAKSVSLPDLRDAPFLVNSLYKAAFGRAAEEADLALWTRELQSGTSLQVVAEGLASSTEFRQRHGTSEEVDIKYISALYHHTLGREPGLDILAFWLAEGEKGATRAKVLAGVAGSAVSYSACLPENGSDYDRWVATFDAISHTDRAVIRAHIPGLAFRPLISVILPVGTASEVTLYSSFNSVVAQLYPYWELCITVDTAAEPHVITTMDDWAARDPRVKLTRLKSPENIATATHAALQSAIGEFVTFLRAGDKLSETALYEVAFELGAQEGADIVYSDQDRIATNGQRSDPWFKPGWDPDLLVAQDYIGDLVVYRRTLVEAVGLLRAGFEGAEFYDLALRATAATSPDRIRHIPAVLYHKSQEGSTSHSENALSSLYAISASHRAVREHLDSKGYTETVLQPAPQMPKAIRVVWPLPDYQPLVSVIIPTRDRADLLTRCIEGILQRTDYSNFEVLIVDNGSAEPVTLKLFERLLRDETRVRILPHPGPFNYSAMNNAAAREAKGEVLLLLNSDVDVIKPVWLRELVSHAIRPDVGVVGAKLIYANELVQHGGVVLGPDDALHIHRFAGVNDLGYFGQLALPRTLLAVTCACAAVRRSVFFEVGGFDEVNLPVTYNDVDFCLRAGDHGYRVVWTPFAELFHLESASRGEDGSDPLKRERALRELEYFRKTWGALLNSADPFHNPNLLFSWGSFEVPASPRRQKPWRDLGEQILTSRRELFVSPRTPTAEC